MPQAWSQAWPPVEREARRACRATSRAWARVQPRGPRWTARACDATRPPCREARRPSTPTPWSQSPEPEREPELPPEPARSASARPPDATGESDATSERRAASAAPLSTPTQAVRTALERLPAPGSSGAARPQASSNGNGAVRPRRRPSPQRFRSPGAAEPGQPRPREGRTRRARPPRPLQRRPVRFGRRGRRTASSWSTQVTERPGGAQHRPQNVSRQALFLQAGQRAIPPPDGSNFVARADRAAATHTQGIGSRSAML